MDNYIRRVFLLLILSVPSCFADESTGIGNNLNLRNISSSLHRAVGFYEKNYDKVNLDSIFGLRAAEGTLKHLVSKHIANEQSVRAKMIKASSREDFQRQLRQIYTSIKTSAGKGYQALAKENSKYLNSFKFIVSSSWFYEREIRRNPLTIKELFKAEEQLSRNTGVSGGQNSPGGDGGDTLTEEFSDKCMKDLMGTSMNTKCTIADDCWQVMNSFGYTGYTITHQSLFFILADVIGCRSSIDSRLRNSSTSFEGRLAHFGSRIFLEMQKETIQKNYSEAHQDLFLEQSIVCHWLGIERCFDVESIRHVISWQDASGCYKDGNPPLVDVQNGEVNGPSRRLQMERTLQDGCQSHTTGLLVAYLAMSLHWLLESQIGNGSIFYSDPSKSYRKLRMLTNSLESVKSIYFLVILTIFVFLVCIFKRFTRRKNKPFDL